MEDRFSQQLKKGILEMLVLKLICDAPNYGYELLNQLKEQSKLLFRLKEGTLYPILYRLEDEGLITASWQTGAGRAAPKKIYEATDAKVSNGNIWIGTLQFLKQYIGTSLREPCARLKHCHLGKKN